jgi:hypothetical protein
MRIDRIMSKLAKDDNPEMKYFRIALPRSTGVNFINVKRARFLYECRFGSFFKYVTCMMFVRKTRAYNIDEIDGCFRQKGYKSVQIIKGKPANSKF